jgi:hypothetical protein
MRRFTATILTVALVAAACSGDDDTDPTTSIGPSTTGVTLVGLPITIPPDATACAGGLPIDEWEINAAVPLPGFVLPDGTRADPAIYRLLFQRGAEGGYDSVPTAARAATDWLPAEFQPDIRSIVVNHLGRQYLFEGALVEAGGLPGALKEPCLLLASDAQIAVWYSIQVLDPLGAAEVYWVWQAQGRQIAIEPFE